MFAIRRLVEDDLEAVWRLRLEALHESPEAFGTTYDEAVARGNAGLRERLADAGDDAYVLGAFAPALCGMVRFTRQEGTKDWHKGAVTSMFVQPGQRGQGIGRALLEELIARARRLEGMEQLQLAVVTSNGAAGALYRALGFVVYGTEPHALKLGSRYWDEDLMILQLRG